MRNGIRFVLGLLWRWEAVSLVAVAVILTAGMTALYGDDFTLATVLFFLAIVLVTTKAVSWKEVTDHKDRVWISVVIVAIALGSFALSLRWIDSRSHRDQTAKAVSADHPAANAPVSPTVPPAKQASPNVQPDSPKVPKVVPKAKVQHFIDQPVQPSLPPPSAGTTNICPNGICISGGTATNPTVNNFAPPDRHLTEDQRTAIVSVINSFPPGIKLQVYTAQAAEPYGFGQEIAALAPKPNKGEDLLVDFETTPKGTYLLINSKDDVSFPSAQALGNAMANHGIPITSFEPHSYVPKGQIRLFICER